MILINSVLVATDFGETSDVALTYGRNLTRAFGGTLHVLHVADNLATTAAADFYPTSLEELQAQVEDAARKRLDALLTSDDRAQLRATPVVRASGGIAHTIVEYAREIPADLIVVGTHGRGPVAHLLMGSVAEKVVRMAPCPVLVVRPNEHEFVVPDPAKTDAPSESSKGV